jgi:DNA-binding PadR family transcriptional regulator
MSLYVKVTKVEKRILEEIARNDPLWLSELVRKVKKQRWTRGIEEKVFSPEGVEKALRRLQKKNLLEVVRTKKLPSGVEQAWYDLTLCGLVEVLTYEDMWDHIDDIAKHKADKLPLVFGKWDYFAKKGAKEQLIAALCWAVDDPLVGFYVGVWNQLPNYKQTLRDRLTERVLFFSMDETSGWSLDYQIPYSMKSIILGAKEWVAILTGDPDLKEYMNRNLERFTERFERYLEDIKLLKMLVAEADRCKYGKV